MTPWLYRCEHCQASTPTEAAYRAHLRVCPALEQLRESMRFANLQNDIRLRGLGAPRENSPRQAEPAKCASCEREQSGLNPLQLWASGWQLVRGRWLCPFCLAAEARRAHLSPGVWRLIRWITVGYFAAFVTYWLLWGRA